MTAKDDILDAGGRRMDFRKEGRDGMLLLLRQRQKGPAGDSPLIAAQVHGVFHSRDSTFRDDALRCGHESELQFLRPGMVAALEQGEQFRTFFRDRRRKSQNGTAGANREGWVDDGGTTRQDTKLPSSSSHDFADALDAAGAVFNAYDIGMRRQRQYFGAFKSDTREDRHRVEENRNRGCVGNSAVMLDIGFRAIERFVIVRGFDERQG